MLTGIPCKGPLSFSGTASSSAAFASASLSLKYLKQVEKLCMLNIQEVSQGYNMYMYGKLNLFGHKCMLATTGYWTPRIHTVRNQLQQVLGQEYDILNIQTKIFQLNTQEKEHLEKYCDCISFLLGGDCSSLVSRQHS